MLFRTLFAPIFLFLSLTQSRRLAPLLRIVLGTLLVTTLFPLWLTADAIAILGVKRGATELGLTLGLLREPIAIAGSGSMYPTFPKGVSANTDERDQETVANPMMRRYPTGFTLFNQQFFTYSLKRGDIIDFSNAQTQALIDAKGPTGVGITGFVKRLIALPGDTIEIRDGFLLVNGEKALEPYTASARSTFGGQTLPDCTPLMIPPDKAFVLGDNRKGSLDSRHQLGLIALADISHVLPQNEQKPFESGWRDATADAKQAHTVTLNTQRYLELLNAIRAQNGVKPLKYQEKLAQSAATRAQVMLKYDDLSFEATRSSLTPQQAMAQAGYANIVYGEAPTLGYYTAEELLENYAQFPSWKKFLLDSTYQETGIAAVLGERNGCPTQMIVQHVAGYVPPNYPKKDIDSWKNLLTNLKNVLPSWERARTFGQIYEAKKQDYERMITILNERIMIVEAIATRMEANQWLTYEEKASIARDQQLADEAGKLSAELNAR